MMITKIIHKAYLFFLFFISLPYCLPAQENDIEMADLMHENGKIYVVIAVISVILAGLLIFLLRIDKKLRRLEKNNRKD